MKKQTAWQVMLGFRAVYLLITISMFLLQDWANAITNSIIFVATLFIPYLGWKKKNNEFYFIDIAVVSIFTITQLLQFFRFFNYNNPYFGPDKIFHFSAGLILAWFASIYLRPHIKNKFVFILAILSFAIAIGGIWEVYEWIVSIMEPPFYAPSSGYADTMLDIIADTLGACCIAGYIWLKK